MISLAEISTQAEAINCEELLQKCRIRGEIVMPDVVLWMHQNGKKKFVFTKGSLSLIRGYQKSGKGLLQSIIMGSKNRRLNILEGNFDKIAVFDTEQSSYYANTAYLRACHRAGHFDMFSLMRYSPEERKSMVEYYIQHEKPDIVFIDHITDFVKNKNDVEQSTDVSQWLMGIAELCQCHICVIVHENIGGDKATGHIGSEIERRIEVAIKLEHDKERSRTMDYFKVTCPFSRNGRFEEFYIYFDKEANMASIEDTYTSDYFAKCESPDF